MVGSDYVGGLEYSTPAGIRYLWGSVDRPTAGGHVGRGPEYSILAGIASFCSPEYSILAGIAYFSGPGVYHPGGSHAADGLARMLLRARVFLRGVAVTFLGT